METDQAAASSENPDQASSDEQQAAGASPARSYECTFCKRGFSNAQALGGHMNIHRRDKAKLKQAASSSPADHKTTHHHHHQRQPSLDNIVVPKNITIPSSYSPNHPTATEAAKYSSSRQELRLSGSPGKWPWVIQDHDVVDDHDNKRPDQLTHIHVGEIRQLPLFDEKPTTTDQNPVSSGARVEGGNEEGLSSGSDQVDLELRLGPERKDSSPTMTTKKFF